MRTTTGSVYSSFPTQPTTPAYSPGVPLSVYRELAADLQASQAKLEALSVKNQQLAQENQHLRQEITKVIQACLDLQKLVDDRNKPNSQGESRTVNKPNSQGENRSVNKPNSQGENRSVNKPNSQVENRTPNKPSAQVKSRTKPLTVVSTTQPVSRSRPPADVERPRKERHEEFYVPVVDVDFPITEPIYIEEQEVRYYTTLETEEKELSGWWLIMFIILIMVTGFVAGYLIVRPLFGQQNR